MTAKLAQSTQLTRRSRYRTKRSQARRRRSGVDSSRWPSRPAWIASPSASAWSTAPRAVSSVTDSAKVRLELEKLTGYTGVLGKLGWTGKANYGVDHQLAVPFYIAEIRNGVEVVRARCTVAEGCK